MNPLEQLVLGWDCLGAGLRALTRPALLVTWIPLLLVRLAVLASVTWAAHPLLSPVMAPLVIALAGPRALHYPELFRVLGTVSARLDSAIAITLGIWTAGVASAQVVALGRARTRSAGGAPAQGTRRLPVLWLAELPPWVLMWLLSDGVALWLAERGSGAITVRILTLLAAGIALFVRAFFSWLPALVVAGGFAASEAWGELGRLAGRGYGAALAIALTVAVPTVPMWLITRAPGRWIDRGHPEWVALWLALEIAITWLGGALATVATTLAWRALDEDPWDA